MATLSFAGPVQADPEGGTQALRDSLEAASKGYNDAKAKADAAKKQQVELSAKVDASQKTVNELSAQVGRLADAAYRGNSASDLTVLLNSGSPDQLLQNAATLQYMSKRDGAQVLNLRKAQATLNQQKKDLDAAIVEQETQLKELVKRRDDALKALRAAGGGDPTLGFGMPPATAQPAPRNPDGSWPNEQCSIRPDPSSGNGCITPRTLHDMNEAKAAGYNHYVSCYRSGEDGGEHPRGRACDFAANMTGFQDVDAQGADRDYGNRLAAFFIANADRLAVLYVIWYRQIWMPGTGWTSYSGSGGPAAVHTNHVHLSVQ